LYVYQRVNRPIFHIFSLEDHPRRTGKPPPPGLQISMRRDEWRRCDPVSPSLANGILGIYVWPRYTIYAIYGIWPMEKTKHLQWPMANGIPSVHT